MLPALEDPAFIHEVEVAIRAFYKQEVSELTYVENSQDNIVVLVNRELVFRFPRDTGAARRLTFETALLQDRKSTRLNSSHLRTSRMPSSA